LVSPDSERVGATTVTPAAAMPQTQSLAHGGECAIAAETIERKVTMTDMQCSCGFTETGDETITDHLLAVFAPEDSRGTDGLIHEEWTTALACTCGVATTTPAELDRHFLTVFTPADTIGHDGQKHAPVAAAEQNGGQ
jgi:hypothetical protein